MYNKNKKWKNILMKILIIIILLLIFILLFFKFKISVYLKLDNFDTFIRIKFGFVEIKRKGTLIKRKRKYQIKKNIKAKLKNLKISPKYIEINKLDIKFILGTPFMFFTVFSVPILATVLGMIGTVPFKKLENYSYVVMPEYNKFMLFSEIEAVFKFRIWDIIWAWIKM